MLDTHPHTDSDNIEHIAQYCLAFYEVAQGGPRGGDTHPPPRL